MTAQAPRVSIVMCVHNNGAYVESAVRSLLNQTMRDFELIVIDDGSRDEAPRILDRLAQQDPRIRLIHQENRGIVASANRGLALARGRYVARQDSDDLSYPDRLGIEAAFLDDHPDVVCVSSHVDLIDHRDRFLKTLEVSTSHEQLDDELMRGHCSIWHTLCMMRREAVERVGGYDPSFATAEDLDLFLRLAEIGRVANLPRALGRYRLHHGGSSQAQLDLTNQNRRRAANHAAARRGVPQRFDALEGWRPSTDAASRHRFTCLYGWWAYASGENRTASLYGCKAIRLRPLRGESWKLAVIPLVRPRQRPQQG